MSRDITVAVATASEARAVAPIFFVNLDIDGDPLWASTLQHGVTLTVASDALLSAGQAFVGAGQVGGISDIVQGADGSVSEVTLSLMVGDFDDATDVDVINDPSMWSMRRGVLWMGLLTESTGAVIADPFRVLTGRIVHLEVVDGSSPMIAVKLAARWTMDGLRSTPWMLGDAHQQTFYSGDDALEFVPQLAGAAINFGVPDQTARTSGGFNGVRSDRRFEQAR